MLTHLHVLERVYVGANPDYALDFFWLGYDLAENEIVSRDQGNQAPSNIVFVYLRLCVLDIL
jgi:hypothetical protein